MVVKKSSWYCLILHAPMAIQQETADILGAVEAFLDGQNASIWFRCKRCHSLIADKDSFIQDLFPSSMKFLLIDRLLNDFVARPRKYPAIQYGPYRLFVGAGRLADAICIDCGTCENWLGYKIIRSNCAVSKPGRLVLLGGGPDDVGIYHGIFPTSDDLALL